MPIGSTSLSLLERVKANEPAAWQQLVELYGPLVYYWCRQQHLNPEDVADIFQEVFRSVSGQIGRFRNDRREDSFRGWLLTITLNKIRDHFRSQRARPEASGGSDASRRLAEIEAPREDSCDVEDPGQKGQFLHRALDLIRGEFENETWLAFWRSTVEGQFAAGIALDLGISVNAVYKAKSRVLHRLRMELKDLVD